MSNTRYNIVIVETTEETAEILSSTVFEYGAKGIEFIDNETLAKSNVPLMEEGKTIIRIFFSKEEDIDEKVNAIENELKWLKDIAEREQHYKLSVTALDDDSWLHNWKKHFKTFKINDRIVIKPSWESYSKKNDEIVIDIDPGTVFGSGTHETTSMCVKMLDSIVKEDDLVLDVGCGTGVLGLVAGKLDAREVLCVDIDPECVVVAKENVVRNRLENKIIVKQGNLVEEVETKADIVVANILADIIIVLLNDIKEVIKADGKLIVSGIIREKEGLVKEHLQEKGFKVVNTLYDGEWVAIECILS